MDSKTSIETRLGSVAFSILGLRHSTLRYFFRDFNINYLEQGVDLTSNKKVEYKNLKLTPNFVFFLIENKTFLLLYQSDYYRNKTIDIIANKANRQQEEIEKFLKEKEYNVNKAYPYRYLSSYAIDFKLQKRDRKYRFLKYDENHRYEGNFEYRRANYYN